MTRIWQTDIQVFRCALTFAQRFLCAAAIFARDFPDILRRLRFGLAVPR